MSRCPDRPLITNLRALWLLASLSIVTASTQGYAATWYLSPSGDDGNPGTQAAPMFSLNRAWQMVAAGDTIVMRGGTYAYNQMQYLQQKNGTPGQLIKVWAAPGETPVITRGPLFNDDTNNQDLIYLEANYVHFKGLEIANNPQVPGKPVSSWSAFRAGFSSHSIFELINYHHNAAGFSIRGDSTDTLILNSDFHHNQDPYSQTPYDGADGLDLNFNPGEANTNTIRGCRAWWNADDGFDLWHNLGTVVIENSWAFYNGYQPDGFVAGGNGVGFKFGETPNDGQPPNLPPTNDVRRIIRGNIAWRNRNFGLVENRAFVGMNIFNNTAARNGEWDYWFGSWGPRPGVTVRNNVSFDPGTAPFLTIGGSSVVDHNSWTGGIDVWYGDTPAQILTTASDFVSLDEAQLLAPRQVDGSLPAISFLHLTPQSALVNAGVDVGLPFVGAAPDLGAFEWADGGAGGGTSDAGRADAGGTDAGSTDAGSTDAGSTDAGSTDAGSTDAGSTDAGSTDAGGTDAGSTDAGSTDSGSTDAGSIDSGGTDAGSTGGGEVITGQCGCHQPGLPLWGLVVVLTILSRRRSAADSLRDSR